MRLWLPFLLLGVCGPLGVVLGEPLYYDTGPQAINYDDYGGGQAQSMVRTFNIGPVSINILNHMSCWHLISTVVLI